MLSDRMPHPFEAPENQPSLVTTVGRLKRPVPGGTVVRPLTLLPQQRAAPPVCTAHVCCAPVATIVTRPRSAGTVDWKLPFDPQHDRDELEVIAQVWNAPASMAMIVPSPTGIVDCPLPFAPQHA